MCTSTHPFREKRRDEIKQRKLDMFPCGAPNIEENGPRGRGCSATCSTKMMKTLNNEDHESRRKMPIY
uniref:SFRICE_026423 n=1 Tax=Spodoptera frugiperda TaxID=7108 RepID=A0A2H1W7Y1_SPOFR